MNIEKKIKNSKYLYDVDAKVFKNKSYVGALKDKIVYATILRNKLVHKDNMKDMDRINAVINAINFNKELLKEVEE